MNIRKSISFAAAILLAASSMVSCLRTEGGDSPADNLPPDTPSQSGLEADTPGYGIGDTLPQDVPDVTVLTPVDNAPEVDANADFYPDGLFIYGDAVYTQSYFYEEYAKIYAQMTQYYKQLFGCRVSAVVAPLSSMTIDNPKITSIIPSQKDILDQMAPLFGDTVNFPNPYEKLAAHKNEYLFFRTDHHWLPTTGLWAAGQIAGWLKETGGVPLREELLQPENYRQEQFAAYFLGSQGKRRTRVLAEPDDFMLLYPKFSTSLHYEIPGLGLDTYGDFSVTYDRHEVERKDFYGSNPYAAYNFADCSLIHIENFSEAAAAVKILVVKDSFANSVAPFLALCVKQMDILDPRWFKGSIRSYIKKTQPDIVLVIHTMELDYPLERDSHQDDYDFR